MGYRIKELFNGQQLTGFDSVDAVVRDISEQTRSFTICASSSREDRAKDIVVQEGLDWSSWLKNPVVPWAHNYQSIPIAKGVGAPWVETAGGVSRSFVRLKMGSHDEASKIFGAVKEGLIRSASIGFLPRKSEKRELPENDEDEHPFRNPTKYIRAEILEVSLVSLPMNPDATMSLKAMVSNGQLPAYVVDGLDSLDNLSEEDEFDLEALVSEWKLDKALKALDGADDFDDEDLDVSRAELEALVKVAVRAALGRLD